MSENKNETEEIAPETAPETATATAPKEETAAQNGEAVVNAENSEEKAVEDASKTNPTDEKSSENRREDKHDRRGHHRDFKKYNKFNNKNKFDPSSLPVTDDAAQIRAQVEFYFGDANLPTDKYLWELTDGSENKPVSIKKIHEFKRMKRFQPYEAVVAALKASHTLDVTGEEGEEAVKRKVPYNPNQPASGRDARSVYVKGFGEEKPTTQFDIEAFFASYGPTNAVRLRRSDDKLFKGSVFVEFADEETAQKFLALDPKPLWQGKEELKIMSKIDYQEEKNKLIKEGKMEPSESRPKWKSSRGHNKGGRGRNWSDRDPDDWKKRREEDQKSGFRNDRSDHRNNNSRGRGRGRRFSDRDDHNNEEDVVDKNGHKSEEAAPSVDKEAAETGKKREREEDAAEDEKPSKKVDTKEEVTAES